MDNYALFNIAVFILRGDGTQRNLPAAVSLLALCVDHGNPNAMNVLGYPHVGNARQGEKPDTLLLRDAFVCGNRDMCFVLNGNILRTNCPHSDNNLTARDQRSMLGGAPLRVPRLGWQQWPPLVPMEAIVTIARERSTDSSAPLTVDRGM